MAMGALFVPDRIDSLRDHHYGVCGDVQKLGHLQCRYWVVHFLFVLALGDQTHLEPYS